MSHHRSITRRDVFKVGAAGALGCFLLGCGSKSDQSETALQHLVKLRHQLPANEYRQIVVAWSKANAAVPFGRAAGLHLSSEMLHHWLYNCGESLDIGDRFLRAIDPSHSGNGSSAPSATVIDYFSISLRQAIEGGLWFSGKQFWLPDQLGDFDNIHEISAARDLNLDIHLGLGRYKVRLRGISRSQDNTLHVLLRAPIEVFDTYEWINETCERAGPFELCQSDMRLLKAYGLGHDYQVSAWIDVSHQELII